MSHDRRTTRSRRCRRLALVTICAVALAACGSDGDSATSSSAAPSSATAASAAATTATGATGASTASAPSDSFPVSVVHALGTTVVPAEPKRIVTVGVTEQDTVLALGIVPVGVTEWYGEQPDATWPWAQAALGGAHPEVLVTDDGLQFEKIAALKPDLIIGTNAGLDSDQYERLSAIAPTIAHPADAPLWFAPWDDQARLIGEATGRTDQMEAIIADVEQQFADAAAAHPEFAGKKVVFLQNAFYDGNAIAYQNGLSTEFLTDLGFVVPGELDQYATDGGQAYIPMEHLDVLDTADVLLWATEKPEDRTALEAEPLYLELAAVRSGHLVFTDGITAGAIYFTSPLSLPYVLQRLVPALASTIAGNGPATITG
ncbi:MAG: iron-siderophore ABC transporter substrate-binding protein [Ilumatobacteraceae bacterium]